VRLAGPACLSKEGTAFIYKGW